MIGAVLLIPFVCIRFIILSILNKDAVSRAAHFALVGGKERLAYWVYQLSNIGILVAFFLVDFQVNQSLFYYFSATVYILGVIILLTAILYFAFPTKNGINTKGIYHLSRNPMYVAYFVYFIGCALLTKSFILFSLTIIFQVSAHWIILSEEKWCIDSFGKEYIEYMNEVKRYI